MNDRGGDGPRGRGGDQGQRDGGDRGGAPDTEFLDLEISKVLFGRAQSMARSVAEEIIRDAIKARMNERFGARLEAIGRLAADELVVDNETNLDIEARIAARREARRAIDGEFGAAMRSGTVGGAPPDSEE